MFLARLALRNPYVVVVMSIAIVVLGLTVTDRIPTDLLPQFKTPAVQVVTLYPGMPAETIERDISTRIQRWTGQSVGIEHQEAKSMLGVCIVKDFFREDIDPNTAMSQVTSYAMSDLYYLPPGTVPPMVMPFDPTASIPVCLFSVKSEIVDGKPRYNEMQLYDFAYFQLRNRLQSIPGVIAPAVYGGKLRRILTYVDSDKLQARYLSPMDVVNSINKHNVFIPTGSARIGNIEYQLESNAMVPLVPQMNDFPIKLDGRAPVLIKDIGKAEDASELQTNVVRVDGLRQLYVPIYRQPGTNTIKVVEGVKNAIPELNKRLPPGIELQVVFDQSTFVREDIKNLAQEGIFGAILAALMILVFLASFRSTFFILLSLPLSIMTSLIFLYFTGNTVNAMTLGGLAIAVGLLIDQSIIVLENTERHLRMGKDPMKAALDGAMEVAQPILIIVVIICIVFFPVMFLTGIGKFLFTPLALSVMFAMGASYVMALTVVPVCCAKFLKVGHEKKGIASRLVRFFDNIQNAYGRVLERVLNVRWGVLIGVLVIFGGTALLYGSIGTELFPQVESGQFTIRVRTISGTKVDETEKLLIKVENRVQELVGKDNIEKIITNIGVFNDWPAAYTPNSGPHDAFVLIQLNEHKKRHDKEYIRLLRKELNSDENFAGVEFAFEPNSMIRAALNFGLSAPINIQVQGNKFEFSYPIAEEIKKRIRQIPGTVDVRIQQRLDAPQFKIEIDRRRVEEIGLDAGDIAKNVVTAFNSSVSFAKSMWIDEKNGNHYWIGAQYPESAFEDVDTLLNVPITGPKQKEPVLLRNLVKLERTTAPSEVMHYNINRVIDIYADVDGRDLGSVTNDIEKELKKVEAWYDNLVKEKKMDAGYTIQRRGEVKSMNESFGTLGFGLALSAVLVYLVLVIQFRSMIQPMVVLLTIPLGLIGVVWALYLTGTYINIQSIMGVTMMIGIAASFTVLIIDFANLKRAEGMSPRQAIIEAAKIRLRPILMTAFAAMFGLLPMAIDGGANIPLARAIIGGVLAKTILSLFVVPVLYVIFNPEPKKLGGVSHG